MRARLGLVLGFLFSSFVACGGKISEDPNSLTSSIPSSSESEPPAEPSGPTDGAWGTWQLLSIENEDGHRVYDPPFVELDLHPDGKAYRWTCSTKPTGDGARCPAGDREGCVVGKIILEGMVWRVQLENEEVTQVIGRGDIEEEASGDIRVNGDGVLHPRAHYRRVGAASLERCMP